MSKTNKQILENICNRKALDSFAETHSKLICSTIVLTIYGFERNGYKIQPQKNKRNKKTIDCFFDDSENGFIRTKTCSVYTFITNIANNNL